MTVYQYDVTVRVKVNSDSESNADTAVAGLETELNTRAGTWLTANNDASDTVDSINNLLYYID